jgi:hypothetical protein
VKEGKIPPLFVLPNGVPVVPVEYKILKLDFLDKLFSMDIKESFDAQEKEQD